jgi:RNA polymerase sigma-70 factor, ECF subfamily
MLPIGVPYVVFSRKARGGGTMEADGLALRSRDGDREAFGRLYDLFSKRIYSYIYYRTLSRETAEDLTSAVFLKALEGLGGYSPGPGGFAAWIYGIARNAVFDHYRRESRLESLEARGAGPWDAADGADLAIDAENRDLWERVAPLLAGMAAEQREILVMRIWDGLSHAEIARILGKSEGACKMAYSRAMASLRAAATLSLLVAFLRGF